MKRILPLHEMARSLGLVSGSLRPNRELCTSDGIYTSFVRKGKRPRKKREKGFVREDMARVMATGMDNISEIRALKSGPSE